ncbi:MAG: S1C family serine protease [Patescibacteria group bacterium]
MFKKLSKNIIFFLAVIVFGGLGGIVADHYVFPRLSSTKFFSKYAFFKNFTEDVTVINKTEQVFVKEETSISKISNQVSSAVVNIASYPDPALKSGAKKSPVASEPKNGTGVIVTSDGLIMTALAAINPENSKYKVMTADGTSRDATLLGKDSYSNLIFLKIDASNLPVAPLGNSDDSKPGEKVIAIGNNLSAYSERYAAGLLSSFDPTYNLAGAALSYSDKLEGVFQTDFNSEKDYVGGPIVDYTGQVVGIVGEIQKNGASEFFEIPSNKVKKVIDRAIKKELDKTPMLGVYYIPITKTYSLNNNLPADKGALIFSPSGQQGLAIIAGSAGQKAGLMINDIIMAVNGQEINLENTLPDMLYQYKKGDEIELTVLRAGQEIKLKAAL